MYKLKDILKVLLIALFVCVYSAGDVYAQTDMCGGPCPEGSVCTKTMSNVNGADEWRCVLKAKPTGDVNTEGQGGATQNANFCGTDGGAFSQLVTTGVLIFKRLRDLIYVVAGFGIIAVAVGGFFGNLNWKWLGAIIISLVVIASAGEIVAMITGCSSFDGGLITNTLTHPTGMSTQEFNDTYTERVKLNKTIDWNDSMDVYTPPNSSSAAEAAIEETGLEENTAE